MTRHVAVAVIGLVLFAIAGVPARAHAPQPIASEPDLSSLPAIEAYLVSIGVDLSAVVVQQGPRNYAGADCPGADWSCTAASVVVQIAPITLPAVNIFECFPGADGTIPTVQKCVVVQTSMLNLLVDSKATCHSESSEGPDQVCDMTQSGAGNNVMEVHQRIHQRGPSPQRATQTSTINQTSTGGSNKVRIFQAICQELPADSGSPQEQNARQIATVTQKSSAGDNSSHVRQSLCQNEEAESDGAITQSQNADFTLGRNEQATVTQTSDSGNNDSHLVQRSMLHQEAESRPGPVTQSQGNFAGGLHGKVTQKINTPNTGLNSSVADLDEDQKQKAETKGMLNQSQAQTGPEDCCTTQMGGRIDNKSLTELSTRQKNQQGGFNQTSDQTGTCSQDVAGATCTAHLTRTGNGVTNHNDCVDQPSCTTFLSCSGGTCVTTPPTEGPVRRTSLRPLPLPGASEGVQARLEARLGATSGPAG